MLKVFLPIWKAKLKEGARAFDPDVYQLNVDQPDRILTAHLHTPGR